MKVVEESEHTHTNTHTRAHTHIYTIHTHMPTIVHNNEGVPQCQ